MGERQQEEQESEVPQAVIAHVDNGDSMEGSSAHEADEVDLEGEQDVFYNEVNDDDPEVPHSDEQESFPSDNTGEEGTENDAHSQGDEHGEVFSNEGDDATVLEDEEAPPPKGSNNEKDIASENPEVPPSEHHVAIACEDNDERSLDQPPEVQLEDEQEVFDDNNDQQHDPHRGDDLEDLDIMAMTVETNIGILLEPVVAEPTDMSMRDLPVVSIPGEDEEIIPISSGKDEEDQVPEPLFNGVRIARSIRNSILRRKPELISVDVEATPIQDALDKTDGIDDDSYEDDEGWRNTYLNSRRRMAQFISARVIRNSPSDDIGFQLRMVDNTHIITEVTEDGLFANSPIQSGDKLISINNQSVLGMKLPGIMTLFQSATDHVTITVQNQRGDGSLVECYAMRPEPTSKIGLHVTNETFTRRSYGSTRPQPVVGSLDDTGLMVDSLLNPGDRILSVNGVSINSARSVAKILRKSKVQDITILAQTKGRMAAVVTTEPEQGTRSRVFDFYGIPARARRIRENDEEVTSGHDSARIGCNMLAIVLCIMAIATPARYVFFIKSRNWVFAILSIFTLANIPWLCRKNGKRFSKLQFLCNVAVIGLALYVWFGTTQVQDDASAGWFCAFYVPLLALVNVPSIFPEKLADESSSAGAAASERFEPSLAGVDQNENV